jgi:hypothetical protein
MNQPPIDYRDAVGRAAEAAAIQHFERLRYHVGRFGVEHLIGPAILPTLYQGDRSPHVSRELVAFLRAMPDLIVARDANESPNGQPELFLVEVKYRHRVELDKRPGTCIDAHADAFGHPVACGHPVALHLYWPGGVTCLGCQYQRVIEYGNARIGAGEPGNVLFYLISDNASLRTDHGIEQRNERVFVNLAFRPKWWYGNDPGLEGKFPIYRSDNTHFAALTPQIVREFDEAVGALVPTVTVTEAS